MPCISSCIGDVGVSLFWSWMTHMFLELALRVQPECTCVLLWLCEGLAESAWLNGYVEL